MVQRAEGSPGAPAAARLSPEQWLAQFHAGAPAVMEDVYRTHFQVVAREARMHLSGADLENAIHNVFLKLLTSESARRSFQGGSLAAWLVVIARHEAIDLLRRHRRDVAAAAALEAEAPAAEPAPRDERLEARQLVARFRREVLPPKWDRVFEARFLRQLSQREAAAELGITRTTLAYQELRIARMLRQFFMTVERKP